MSRDPKGATVLFLWRCTARGVASVTLRSRRSVDLAGGACAGEGVRERALASVAACGDGVCRRRGAGAAAREPACTPRRRPRPAPGPRAAPASERGRAVRGHTQHTRMCHIAHRKKQTPKSPGGGEMRYAYGHLGGVVFTVLCTNVSKRNAEKVRGHRAAKKCRKTAPHFSRKAAHTRAYVARRPHIAQNVSMQRAARCSNPSARAAADALGHVAAGDGRLGGGGGGAGGGAEAGRDTRQLRGGERGVYKAMGRR